MSVDTNIYPMKDDLGKNLYRKKTYYTLVVEQDVLAKDKDEADQKFLDQGYLYWEPGFQKTLRSYGQ